MDYITGYFEDEFDDLPEDTRLLVRFNARGKGGLLKAGEISEGFVKNEGSCGDRNTSGVKGIDKMRGQGIEPGEMEVEK